MSAMTLCYYVTGHGYGHAIRTAQVIRALPPNLPVIVKTTVPQRLFIEELKNRAFELIYAEYDCGCIQPDSVTILRRETLDHYRAISERNAAILGDEVRFLQERGVSVVASDVPSFPIEAAHHAGIPSVVTSNFTWYDVYLDYIETSEDRQLVDAMALQYGLASLALISELEVATTPGLFNNVERVPLAARIGVSRREALARHIQENGAPKDAHIGLLYMGTWGLDIDWTEVEKLRDWWFVTYDPMPRPVANVTSLDRREWIYADTVASADAMICKVGYGTTTDCIGNGTPMIHLPRRDFVEYQSLADGMDRWGGRVELTEADFVAGRWRKALDASRTVSMQSDLFRTDGAQVIADRLAGMVCGT